MIEKLGKSVFEKASLFAKAIKETLHPLFIGDVTATLARDAQLDASFVHFFQKHYTVLRIICLHGRHETSRTSTNDDCVIVTF